MKWEELSAEEKETKILELLLACTNGVRDGNPVVLIWLPQGTEEEFKTLWAKSIEEKIVDREILKPENPFYKFYFPDLKETDKIELPQAEMVKQRNERDLRGYLNNIIKYADLKPEAFGGLFINLDVLTAFFLVGEVLVPAIAKRSAEEKEASKSRIILP